MCLPPFLRMVQSMAAEPDGSACVDIEGDQIEVVPLADLEKELRDKEREIDRWLEKQQEKERERQRERERERREREQEIEREREQERQRREKELQKEREKERERDREREREYVYNSRGRSGRHCKRWGRHRDFLKAQVSEQDNIGSGICVCAKYMVHKCRPRLVKYERVFVC